MTVLTSKGWTWRGERSTWCRRRKSWRRNLSTFSKIRTKTPGKLVLRARRRSMGRRVGIRCSSPPEKAPKSSFLISKRLKRACSGVKEAQVRRRVKEKLMTWTICWWNYRPRRPLSKNSLRRRRLWSMERIWAQESKSKRKRVRLSTFQYKTSFTHIT